MERDKYNTISLTYELLGTLLASAGHVCDDFKVCEDADVLDVRVNPKGRHIDITISGPNCDNKAEGGCMIEKQPISLKPLLDTIWSNSDD